MTARPHRCHPLAAAAVAVWLWTVPAAHAADVESMPQKYGDITQLLMPAAAFVSTLAVGDREGMGQFLKGFAANEAVTYTLKYTVREERPRSTSRDSFPSGHTSSAFQGAAFIQRRYGWGYGWLAYIGALYTGVSRVESGRHHTRDVVAGGLIGIASSYHFTTPYARVGVAPLVAETAVGAALTGEF